jgi:hypothetical protein
MEKNRTQDKHPGSATLTYMIFLKYLYNLQQYTGFLKKLQQKKDTGYGLDLLTRIKKTGSAKELLESGVNELLFTYRRFCMERLGSAPAASKWEAMA